MEPVHSLSSFAYINLIKPQVSSAPFCIHNHEKYPEIENEQSNNINSCYECDAHNKNKEWSPPAEKQSLPQLLVLKEK